MTAVVASEAVIKVRIDTSGASLVLPEGSNVPGSPTPSPTAPQGASGSTGGTAGKRKKFGTKSSEDEDLVDQVMRRFDEAKSSVLESPDTLKQWAGGKVRSGVRAGANRAIGALADKGGAGGLAATGGYAAGLVMGAYAAVKAAPFVTGIAKGLIPKEAQQAMGPVMELINDLNKEAVRLQSWIAAVAAAASRAERLAGAAFTLNGEGKQAVQLTPQGIYDFAQQTHWIETRLGMKTRFMEQRAIEKTGEALGNFIVRGARSFSQR